MARQTSGEALGQLILQKRRAAGLTQTQLAEDAYETSAKVRRISELESGKVANPHPATIDPIIVALGITDEELERCARQGSEGAPTDLDEAFRSARNLIEAIAKKFEHDNPNASLSELDDFLRAKATEWRALKERIQQIEAPDVEIDKLREDAVEALARGDFDAVDSFLAEAEERHQEVSTLAAVEKQAQIRITRADTSLLRSDYDKALESYRIAARFFQPFDIERMIETLQSVAWRIYETSLRTIPPTFWIAEELLRDLSEIPEVASDAHRSAVVNYRRGLVLRNEAAHRDRESSDPILDRAIRFAKLSMDEIEKTDDDYQKVCCAVSLANCLMERGRRSVDPTLIDEAISALKSAKVIASEVETAAPLLPHVLNSLGSCLLYKAGAQEKSENLLHEALCQFQAAVASSEDHADYGVWGGAKANVARLLFMKAQSANLSADERAFLRVRAIADYQAAIETFPVTVFSDRFAEISYELGNLLFHHALSQDDQLSEMYLFRALEAYKKAVYINSKENNPKRWADIHSYVGTVFVHHGALVEDDAKEYDYQQALECFNEAKQTYSESGYDKEADKCEVAIQRLVEEAKKFNIDIRAEGAMKSGRNGKA